MADKGGYSFVAMLVINPIVILFYQNCSMAPVSQARTYNPAPAVVSQPAQPVATRAIASESSEAPVVAIIKPGCDEKKKECLRAE